MPSRSSLGESSLPVSESPAEFQPTESHGTPPSWKIVGSPATCFSIPTMCSSGGGAQVVRVADEQVTVGGRARTGHDVAAPALRDHPPRLVPELLDRGREEIERIDRGRLGDAFQLLDEPGQAWLGEREVLLRQSPLLVDRAPGGQVVESLRRLGMDAVAGGLPELAAGLQVVGARDPDDLDARRRGHDVSSPMSDPNAST